MCTFFVLCSLLPFVCLHYSRFVCFRCLDFSLGPSYPLYCSLHFTTRPLFAYRSSTPLLSLTLQTQVQAAAHAANVRRNQAAQSQVEVMAQLQGFVYEGDLMQVRMGVQVAESVLHAFHRHTNANTRLFVTLTQWDIRNYVSSVSIHSSSCAHTHF